MNDRPGGALLPFDDEPKPASPALPASPHQDTSRSRSASPAGAGGNAAGAAASGDDRGGPASEDDAPRPGSRLAPLAVRDVNESSDTILAEAIGPVWVTGEISRFMAHGSGHWYFTLKDDDSASIPCAMFRGRNQGVRFRPRDGLKVLLLATPRVYVQQGKLQLIVDAIEPAGEGAAALALEQLKQRLAAEGIFDAARKKSLPLLPRRLGIVTSADGAALRDVLHVLRRRFAGVFVLLAPATVQGPTAPDEIADALDRIDRRGLDVLLLVRGGGAREDLAAFDDERVVRAVARCTTPVVTGIGHEIDTTLSDYAADLRAPTPSAAAELVVRERDELARRVSALERSLAQAVRARAGSTRERLLRATGSRGMRDLPRRIDRLRLHGAELQRRGQDALAARVATLRTQLRGVERRLSPQARLAALEALRRRLASARTDALAAVRRRAALARERLARVSSGLDALSPLAVLERGYALVTLPARDGAIARDAGVLSPGDTVHVRLARGQFDAAVTGTTSGGGTGAAAGEGDGGHGNRRGRGPGSNLPRGRGSSH